MAAAAPLRPKPVVHYPDSDGEPMSENPLQFDWIAILKWGAEAEYRDRSDVFVAGDHMIYPVEGNRKERQAPDAYVVFGRPKVYRGSYKVWEEGGVFPQVVFEVWSPRNRFEAMQKKFAFYDRHGVEEYYIVYPEFPGHFDGWVRAAGKLEPVAEINGHVSPRLGWRFGIIEGELSVYGRDGKPLERPDETAARADRLAAKLRELGVDPDAV